MDARDPQPALPGSDILGNDDGFSSSGSDSGCSSTAGPASSRSWYGLGLLVGLVALRRPRARGARPAR